MRRTMLFILFILFLGTEVAFAQIKKDSTDRHTLGLVFGYGGKDLKFAKLNISYDYQVKFFQLNYSYKIIPSRRFDLELVVTPQINRSRYRYNDASTEISYGWERGVTVGGASKFHTPDRKFSVFVLISSGPLSITGSPDRQSKGLNFSSNLILGMNVKIFKNLFFDIHSGFRHLSNAQLRSPNRGLNVLFLNSGVSYTL